MSGIINEINFIAMAIPEGLVSLKEILVFFVAPLFVLCVILLFMHFWFRLPLRPEQILGSLVFRSPHNFRDLPENKKMKYNGVKSESLSKLWRMIVMDDYVQSEDNYLNSRKKAKIIYGECSDTITIEHALYRGLSVDLILGPLIRDAKSRKRLSYLKEKYKNNLNIYSTKDRPPRHAVKIGDNLLIEDYHSIEEDYQMSTSIINASPQVVRRFDEYFNDLRFCGSTKELITANDILNLLTIEEANLLHKF